MDLLDESTNSLVDHFYLVSVAYDGSKFAGWAKQPGLLTVQGLIEAQLSVIFKRKVTILAASRTDKGVHALDQKFTFRINIKLDEERLSNLLKRSLGDYITTKIVRKVTPSLHPINDVLFKEYRYYIRNEETNIFFASYYWYYNKPLPLTRLRSAVKIFEGQHDFFNFSYCRKRDRAVTNTVRSIRKVTVTKHGTCIIIKFFAKGFLRYQIRAIVGEAVHYASSHDSELPKFAHRLTPGVDSKYTRIAPPCGLYLWKITMKEPLKDG